MAEEIAYQAEGDGRAGDVNEVGVERAPERRDAPGHEHGQVGEHEARDRGGGGRDVGPEPARGRGGEGVQFGEEVAAAEDEDGRDGRG